MEFRTLEVFHAVATTKSFARAAEVLHMTQSAVSQRIASLEAQLGCRVLDCTNRSATLTPKGYILFGYAEKLPATRSELIQTLTEMESESRLIRLCVAETIAQTWLPTFIGAVSVRYPLVIFEIEVDVSTNLRARLLRQEIDLAFLLGKVVEPGIGHIDLCAYPLGFVAGASLTFDEMPISPEAVAKHALVTFPRSTVPYSTLQQIFQERSIRLPRIHSSSSVSTIIKLTLDGIGISLLTPALIGTELREGRLAVLDVAVTLPMLEYVTGSGGQIWTILPKLQPTWRASMRSNITFASIKLYA